MWVKVRENEGMCGFVNVDSGAQIYVASTADNKTHTVLFRAPNQLPNTKSVELGRWAKREDAETACAKAAENAITLESEV